jgi:hypothetical protein
MLPRECEKHLKAACGRSWIRGAGRRSTPVKAQRQRADANHMSVIGLRRLVGLGQPRPDASHEPASYTTAETVLLLVAAVTCVAGLIHIGAAVDHYGEFPLYTLVFAAMAVIQLTWAAAILRGPSRRVLLFGCAFNVGVIALWAASRTVGVPVAPRAWVPEAVGVADLLATVDELLAVISVASVLMSTRMTIAKGVVERVAPLLLIVLLASVLYGVGAHAG